MKKFAPMTMRRVVVLGAALALLGACSGKTHAAKELAPALKPSWTGHVYACDYEYPHGAVMRLSVEDDGAPAADTYFAMLATKLHKTQDLTTRGAHRGRSAARATQKYG